MLAKIVPTFADALLKEGGGERLNYFSHCVTHCIVGNNALESDITDATELYEIPALREEWYPYIFSITLDYCTRTEGFIAGTNCLFANVTACISGLSKMDANKLWAMVIFHGGKVQSLFNRSCTHLITSKKEGAKYKRAVRHGRFIRTVTPDWVVDSVRVDACSNPAANMSTAQILGFTDDDMDTGQLLVSSSKASAMEQLRQRMPWNQPTSNQPKIPTSTAITGSPSLQEQLQQFHLVQQRLAEAEISSSLSPAQGVPHEGHHQQEVTTQNIHKALGPPVAANQSKAFL
uniref:BRCT domain-containing protein n=1 Tax=Timema cristinae TaxID=61476 RepID=A0A7R9H0A2_TIMCR|nr:unnamed protein product [Timema cristinae]